MEAAEGMNENVTWLINLRISLRNFFRTEFFFGKAGSLAALRRSKVNPSSGNRQIHSYGREHFREGRLTSACNRPPSVAADQAFRYVDR